MNINTAVQPGPLLELDLLRTLVAIAETGNFSAAADRLGRTPSAVSMQVKKMEEMVGAALFVRDSRSVSLTRDGEALLQHGRRLLALNREMMTRFARPDLVGEVHLGAPDDVAERFLPTMLRHFAETHPGVILNVLVDGTRRLKEMVDEQTLDLAIVTAGSALTKARPRPKSSILSLWFGRRLPAVWRSNRNLCQSRFGKKGARGARRLWRRWKKTVAIIASPIRAPTFRANEQPFWLILPSRPLGARI
jgi:DNA-binding transcriptional LysR family regulator